jgi:hypothetical protein
MIDEIWKDILDYEGLYQVSNLGNIKSLNYRGHGNEGLLKPSLNSKKYYLVGLCKNKKSKSKQVHQLVAMSFLNHKPCGHKLVVNHINFIKTDNRLENLEIITQRENANHKHLKSTSKYVGVYWSNKSKKWISQITIGEIPKNLGSFDNELEASQYYENAVIAIKNGQDIKTKPKNFTSNYIGVSRDNVCKKWRSCIYVKGKNICLGTFEFEEDAYQWYINAKIAIKNKTEIKVNKKIYSSKYKGISWNKRRNKWIAQTTLNGKKVSIGGYDTEIEAKEAYENYKKQITE